MSTTIEAIHDDSNMSQHVLPHIEGCTRHRKLFGDLHCGPHYKEDSITVSRNVRNIELNFSLFYRIYNPSAIHSSTSPPLVVLHGGPSLPSDYLYPLVQHIPSTRSVIFYDQLGCGKSCQPEDEEMYSIEYSVSDLEKLIMYLNLKKHHILGHSFGGILAFEYIKRKLSQASSSLSTHQCLSLVLANTPYNMRISLEECERLYQEVKLEVIHEMSKSYEGDQSEHLSVANSIKEKMSMLYEYKTQAIPEALAKAVNNRGKTAWSGSDAISDYIALSPFVSHESCKYSLPSVLVIRGEFDFITEKCIMGWRKIFSCNFTSKAPSYREEIMKGCAHYCHLEDANNFCDLVKKHLFINDY